ncbi:MAG: hypothetical protein ACFFA3_09715 [Promethearchaeota archaeon]
MKIPNRKILGFISIASALLFLTIGILLTNSYLLVKARRIDVCMCYIVDIGLFYSILTNLGIGLVLFGFHKIFIKVKIWIEYLISFIFGISLIGLAAFIHFGDLSIHFDIKINFLPYFISGLLLVMGVIIMILRKHNFQINMNS